MGAQKGKAQPQMKELVQEASAALARLDAERTPHVAAGEQVHLAVRAERVLLFAPDGQRIRTCPNHRLPTGVVDTKATARRGYGR